MAIGPGAHWICKTWPIDRFIRLADALIGDRRCFDGAGLLLVGGAEELEISRPFWRAFPADRIVEAFRADVPTTAALPARCNLFVINDSAMMHLAAAVVIPTVGLFRPTNEEHYGPWGDNGPAIRTPRPVETLLATRWRGEPHRTLLVSLTVEGVLEAIAKRWPDLRGHRAGDGADDRIRIASDG